MKADKPAATLEFTRCVISACDIVTALRGGGGVAIFLLGGVCCMEKVVYTYFHVGVTSLGIKDRNHEKVFISMYFLSHAL